MNAQTEWDELSSKSPVDEMYETALNLELGTREASVMFLVRKSVLEAAGTSNGLREKALRLCASFDYWLLSLTTDETKRYLFHNCVELHDGKQWLDLARHHDFEVSV